LALADILETIRLESQAAAAGLVADAESQAEQILERARKQAQREERRLAGSLDDRIRGERARSLSRSHLEAARSRRAAREDAYQQAIEGVKKRLSDLRDTEAYARVLDSLLEEAVSNMPEGRTTRVDARDSESVERIIADRRLDLTVELDDFPLGGLVLVAPGRTVDNRLATRLERAGPHLRFVAGEITPELRGRAP
jgi:vacuolar-type H+-ATPase subunit E/Vma4